VTEQLNAPAESTVVPQSVIEAPASIEVETVAPGVKPLPEAVTTTPLGPCPGLSVIAGRVTVKAAVALSKLPSEPVAFTMYVAGVEDVIVTVQENAPPAVTEAPHAEMVAPEPIVVVIDEAGVKPVPDTSTPTPVGPCDGESTIEGTVTWNVVDALSKAPSEPEAVIRYGPGVAAATVTAQLKVPLADTVASQLETEAPLPTVVVMDVLGVNPTPVTVVVTPLGP